MVIIWYISTHFCNSRIWQGDCTFWTLGQEAQATVLTFEWRTETVSLPSSHQVLPFPPVRIHWRSLWFGWTTRGAALTETFVGLFDRTSCRRRRRGCSCRPWRSSSVSAFRMSAATNESVFSASAFFSSQVLVDYFKRGRINRKLLYIRVQLITFKCCRAFKWVTRHNSSIWTSQ